MSSDVTAIASPRSTRTVLDGPVVDGPAGPQPKIEGESIRYVAAGVLCISRSAPL